MNEKFWCQIFHSWCYLYKRIKNSKQSFLININNYTQNNNIVPYLVSILLTWCDISNCWSTPKLKCCDSRRVFLRTLWKNNKSLLIVIKVMSIKPCQVMLQISNTCIREDSHQWKGVSYHTKEREDVFVGELGDDISCTQETLTTLGVSVIYYIISCQTAHGWSCFPFLLTFQ